MKVLYLGVYRDGTGWGNAATDYILALDAVGVDVVPRPIKLSTFIEEPPQRITELEGKKTKGCDVVIQHILPQLMDYNGQFKRCIGLYSTETSHFRGSQWASHLNLMDEAWVTSKQMLEAANESFVSKPIALIPQACDVSKYAKRYEKYPIAEVSGRFVFYTIGELNRRKNLVALLKAFHLEFHPQEPVTLLIKATSPGRSTTECNKHLRVIIESVKRELKLYKSIDDYHNELLITQPLSNLEMLRLHSTCDCFVMPSFGEAWCIPAFDAMALGKTPICTDIGGMADFIRLPNNKEAGWLVPATLTPVFGMNETLPGLYRGDELWADISIPDLRKAMREAYENKQMRREKAELGIDRAYDFSHEAIGQKMLTLLNQGCTWQTANTDRVNKTHNLDFLKVS